jgi:hypothetical protein
MSTAADGVTVSMVEVDAAAARAALADQLQLARVDLEHPAVVAVLAAVVAAGWRPPAAPGGNGMVTDPVEEPPSMSLFGDAGFGDSAESPPARAPVWGFPW